MADRESQSLWMKLFGRHRSARSDRRPPKVHVVLRSAEGTFPQITDLQPLHKDPQNDESRP